MLQPTSARQASAAAQQFHCSWQTAQLAHPAMSAAFALSVHLSGAPGMLATLLLAELDPELLPLLFADPVVEAEGLPGPSVEDEHAGAATSHALARTNTAASKPTFARLCILKRLRYGGGPRECKPRRQATDRRTMRTRRPVMVTERGKYAAAVGVAEHGNPAVLVAVAADGKLLDRRRADLTPGPPHTRTITKARGRWAAT